MRTPARSLPAPGLVMAMPEMDSRKARCSPVQGRKLLAQDMITNDLVHCRA